MAVVLREDRGLEHAVAERQRKNAPPHHLQRHLQRLHPPHVGPFDRPREHRVGVHPVRVDERERRVRQPAPEPAVQGDVLGGRLDRRRVPVRERDEREALRRLRTLHHGLQHRVDRRGLVGDPVLDALPHVERHGLPLRHRRVGRRQVRRGDDRRPVRREQAVDRPRRIEFLLPRAVVLRQFAEPLPAPVAHRPAADEVPARGQQFPERIPGHRHRLVVDLLGGHVGLEGRGGDVLRPLAQELQLRLELLLGLLEDQRVQDVADLLGEEVPALRGEAAQGVLGRRRVAEELRRLQCAQDRVDPRGRPGVPGQPLLDGAQGVLAVEGRPHRRQQPVQPVHADGAAPLGDEENVALQVPGVRPDAVQQRELLRHGRGLDRAGTRVRQDRARVVRRCDDQRLARVPAGRCRRALPSQDAHQNRVGRVAPLGADLQPDRLPHVPEDGLVGRQANVVDGRARDHAGVGLDREGRPVDPVEALGVRDDDGAKAQLGVLDPVVVERRRRPARIDQGDAVVERPGGREHLVVHPDEPPDEPLFGRHHRLEVVGQERVDLDAGKRLTRLARDLAPHRPRRRRADREFMDLQTGRLERVADVRFRPIEARLADESRPEREDGVQVGPYPLGPHRRPHGRRVVPFEGREARRAILG